ncbi:hypothetical protein IE53DRAFT_383298 [Violaceomyces palustris]|uniref:Uncharacterized protein n=1 Tax=Violaceomyces palustris TaxID=1673888 RepID=A0ACD0P818_9BASI|nr:hypothetical protein IE53DRAFT_383298 [Violaceomyces palustris]
MKGRFEQESYEGEDQVEMVRRISRQDGSSFSGPNHDQAGPGHVLEDEYEVDSPDEPNYGRALWEESESIPLTDERRGMTWKAESDSGSDQDGHDDVNNYERQTRSRRIQKIKDREGKRKPLKWNEVAWVSATLLLITVLCFTSQIFIIWPYFSTTASFTLRQLLTLLIPFNLGVFMIYYNYFLCVKTHPGSVPKGWEPDWTALEITVPVNSYDPVKREATVELKQYSFKPRYCRTCRSFKPPRSHHCKTCGRCVLRMDHHCPWLANCVGHANYGHFIRFLASVDYTCSFHLVMISMRVIDYWNDLGYWREPSTKEMLFLVLNYALCIPVLLLVGIFSIYHFYCLCINMTTIESWEKDKVATMVRRGKIRSVKYPYSLGIIRNAKAVLGPSPLLWCFPKKMHSDGLYFEVGGQMDPGAQYRWPPKDPAQSAQLPSGALNEQRSNRDQAPSFGTDGLHSLTDRSDRGGARAHGPFQLAASPFTYGSGGFNPLLRPSNSSTVRSKTSDRWNDDQGLRKRVTSALGGARGRNLVHEKRGEEEEDEGSNEIGCIPPRPPRSSHRDSAAEGAPLLLGEMKGTRSTDSDQETCSDSDQSGGSTSSLTSGSDDDLPLDILNLRRGGGGRGDGFDFGANVWHPDSVTSSSASSSNDDGPAAVNRRVKVRRGSEGLEVKPFIALGRGVEGATQRYHHNYHPHSSKDLDRDADQGEAVEDDASRSFRSTFPSSSPSSPLRSFDPPLLPSQVLASLRR